MHLLDAVGILLLLMAVATFGLGEEALARSDDFEAIYWLVVGVVGLRATVQLVGPGKP